MVFLKVVEYSLARGGLADTRVTVYVLTIGVLVSHGEMLKLFENVSVKRSGVLFCRCICSSGGFCGFGLWFDLIVLGWASVSENRWSVFADVLHVLPFACPHFCLSPLLNPTQTKFPRLTFRRVPYRACAPL